MSNVLDGIKVIEVASFWAAPSVGAQMSDFGAEVIHVEPPGHGDVFRALYKMPPLKPSETNYPWLLANRNKKSLALNLKNQDARSVLYKLCADADVFITNSVPRVLRDLEISYEKIKSFNEKIVYALFTGYGEGGPDDELAGYDETAWWARTGMMNSFRATGTEPICAPTGVGDASSGIGLLAAIMTGLFNRERTGKGSKVSTSLMQCGMWSNAIQIQGALVGCDPFETPPHEETANPMAGGIYATKDDRRIFMMQINPKGWEPMCDALGCSQLKTDPRFDSPGKRIQNAFDLNKEFDTVFGSKTLAEIREQLGKAKTVYAVVQTNEECPDDPQMNALGCLPEIEGTNGIRTVQSPVVVEGYEKVTPQPAPDKVGQDTAAILKESGYSDDEIAKLAESGAIGVAS